MMILITGGSKCGKSVIAENILSPVKTEKYYIATMEPRGEEAERAIASHRRMRHGKRFLTIEQARNIGALSLPLGSSALLECVPTLTANEMFAGKSNVSRNEKQLVDKIVSGVVELSKATKMLVVVTNDVGCDGIAYAPETTAYIETLGEINRRLADIADRVIEAVYGIPVVLKGAKS